MATTTVYRSPRRFSVEHLETRLSLSTGTLTPDNDVLTQSDSTSLVSELDTTSQQINLNSDDNALPEVSDTTTPLVGDTYINGKTKLDLSDYSGIQNAKVVVEGGREIVGYVATSNSWIEYKVYASKAGTYTIDTDFAAPSGTARVDLYVNGANAGQYTAGWTASWSTYATQSKNVTLSQGWNTIRYVTTNNGYNIGDIVITPPGTSQTVGSSTSNIDLEQYSSLVNSKVTAASGFVALEYVQVNSYIEFSIDVQSTGNYTLSLDVASPGNTSTVDAKIDGVTKGSVTFGNTGGWQTYINKSVTLNLTAGVHTFRLQSNNSVYNLKNIVFKQASTDSGSGSSSGSGSNSGSSGSGSGSGSGTGTNTGTPVTVSTQNMTSFTQLNITGTSGVDNITLTQSGNTLTLTANGYTTTYNASSYGNIVIKGGDGNDVITIDGSVKVITLIYGNAGNDVLTHKAANGTIVAIGDGTDTVVGNGANTSIWIDTADSVSGYSASTLHKVSSFYGGVSLNLSGQNLADPVGGKGVTRLNNSSLWGTGPTSSDVVQGQLGDCYLLASMQGLADENPSALKELAVDLGDGTYAIQFKRNGVTTYVRVDGDLPAGGYYQNGVSYAHPGASGNQWMAIIEKAYAIFRTGSNSYASISSGWMTSVFSDFGFSAQSVSLSNATSFYNTVVSALNSGRTVTFGTKTSITSGTPLIASHAYSIVGISMNSSGVLTIAIRNPWGFDGAGNDGNANDAKLNITFAQLVNNNIGVVLA